MGDKEVGSNTDFVGEFWKRSSPSPLSGGGVGGVGGDTNIGLSFMFVAYMSPQ